MRCNVAEYKIQPEDHWSCFAHLSAEDMLKSLVIEEKKFKHSPWAGADYPLRLKFLCQQEGLITKVIHCKFKKNVFNLLLYTHLFTFNKCIGAATTGDIILMSSCHFGHLLQVLKNSL